MTGLGNKEIIAKNIRYYMNLKGKTRQDICNDLNFQYTTFVDWEKGNTYPRIDKIEILANYFGIQKSDLIEDRTTQQATTSFEEDWPEVVQVLRRAGTKPTQEERQQIADIIRLVRKEEGK